MNAFEEMHVINEFLILGNEEDAREKIIRLVGNLDYLDSEDKKIIIPPLNDLLRQVGLYPYIDKDYATWQEQILLNAFSVDIGGKEVVLHREQSKLLSGLLDGKNLAVSAPTSFGKSFTVDAFLQLRKPKTVMMIVPTIALADEIRRRLQPKFGRQYKIITTSDIELAEKNILILPQERALSYIGVIEEIDLLVVDEFYKASEKEKDSRSITLQRAMLEFQRIAKQRYYLAPNIQSLTDSIFTKGVEFVSIDCNTVALDIEHTYEKINDNYDKNKALFDILDKVDGKTLIYVKSHTALDDVLTLLSENIEIKENQVLNQFSSWIKKNYSPTWKLRFLLQKGVCTHNSNLHRSLSQIQLHLYETVPLDLMVSTSSIIEGVNTSTKNIVLWSNKIGSSSLKFFTYKNIMGRSGRMFKYFIGNAFLLEKPPKEVSLELDLALQDEASLLVDEDYLNDELTPEELRKIISFKKEMANLLGVKYSELISFQDLDASNKSLLQKIAHAVLAKNLNYRKMNLLNADDEYWETSLLHILNTVHPSNLGGNYYDIIKCILVLKDNWKKNIPELLTELENYDLGIDEFFKIEKIITYNLSSFLKSLQTLYNKKNERELNINNFIEKISHAFLPKNVFFLEEYGLPRFLSKKICLSGLINLENNDLEINDVVGEFLNIGIDQLIEEVESLDIFDEYVLKIFYEGIELKN
ncbi:DEAD/DEAH box helicase [Acinetobacter sp. BWR-L5]|uniref:DEAD/DEAH box helicase n=1 Tax=Acinetobacter sp. BWR-L5 TaxID=2815725 RepID=UPI0031FEF042